MALEDITTLAELVTAINEYFVTPRRPPIKGSEENIILQKMITLLKEYADDGGGVGYTPENVANKNQPNGYAGLDGSGKVASAQLPSYVDDVIEVANYAALPGTGETGKIYVTLDTNLEYRWSGSAYIQIVASPGTTDALSEGTTNKYFTAARVLATVLTGIGFGSSAAITATDSILSGLGKLQAQITALFKVPAGGATGQVLAKGSNADGDLNWITPTGGGGGVSGLSPKQIVYGKSDGTIEQKSSLVFDPATETLNMNAKTADVSAQSIVFIGDSIVTGTGTTDNKRFTKQVADGLSMTEANYGQGGSTVVTFDTSTIPTKTSSLKYLFVALGVNDAASSTTNTQFKTDYITFLNAIIAKGWAYGDITLLSINGASTNGTSAAKIVTFNTAIQQISVTYSTGFIDIYNPMLNAGYGQQFLTSDLLHPNNLGATIMARVILGSFGVNNFNSTGKRILIDGPTELSKLAIKNPIISTGSRLLLLDDSGNIVSSFALPDGVTTNGVTYMNGGIHQIDAVDFVTFDPTKDLFLKGNAKIASGNNQGAVLVLFNTATGSTEYRNYFGSGQHEFYITNGTNGAQVLAVFIDSTGLLNASKGVNIGQSKYIQTLVGAGYGRLTLFDAAGLTILESTYSAGRIDFKTSNGTNNNSVKMMQIQASGRVQVGSNVSDSDVPSARFAVSSTTEGFLKPRMTTTQRDAITSPEEGLEIYNLTTHKMNFYNGSAWEAITSA